VERRPLLQDLPDISVRFAVGELTASGGFTFGPVKLTAQGGSYRAVLDYVNVDAVPVDFQVRKRVVRRGATGRAATMDTVAPFLGLFTVVDTSYLQVLDYEAVAHTQGMTPTERGVAVKDGFDIVTVPVYVGIGMRLTAEIKAAKGNIALNSLGAIAAEAQLGSLTGTLTVQTLGVTGRSVATILPLPSKLDQTTVENGILALGSSRTALYGDGTDVVRTPRVVGMYSPFGSDPRLVNALYAALSKERPPLARTCAPVGGLLPGSEAGASRGSR
jgi:hypothetical protein